MESDYYIQICARNSRGHRQEKEFVNWLTNIIEALIQKGTFNLTIFKCAHKNEWRDIIAHDNSTELGSIFDRLEDELGDCITEIGECIASVDYEHHGMGHSGSNSVYELCGVFWLEGSDFCEGPTENKYELLEYLDVDNPDHEVFWSEYAD